MSQLRRKMMFYGPVAAAVWTTAALSAIVLVVFAALVFNAMNQRELGSVPGTDVVFRLPTQDPMELAIRRTSVKWPNDHRRAFFRRLAAPSVQSGGDFCLPPSVTLAQAALESAWGRSEAAMRFNNLFGLKANKDTSAILLQTDEVIGGRRVRITARFMTFPDYAAALHEHDRRIATLGAYHRARAVRDQGWETYIHALAPVYATDPHYATKVSGMIERYGLDAFDELAMERAQRLGSCLPTVQEP